MEEDRQLEELKLHAQAVSDAGHSPLIQIREKELEIRGRVMEAQKEAEKIVADARARSATLIEEASRETEKEAAEYYQGQLASVEDEVKELAESQDQQIATMLSTARNRLDTGVDSVLKAIVP